MSSSAEYVRVLWKSGALLVDEEPFTLKSGRVSYVYANHRNLVCVPDRLALLADVLIEASQQKWSEPFAIASVDSSVSPYLVAACSLRGSLPFYNLRAVSREKGLSEELFAYSQVADSRIDSELSAVLIDDVVTTMGTLAWAATSLQQQGVRVLGATCLLDRRLTSEARKSVMDVAPVATLGEVLLFGLEHAPLSDAQRRVIEIEFHALRN